METVRTTYLGDLRTKSIHVKSGNELITDAPADNKGRGEYFSPTDLTATSLGGCIVTTMGIAANTHGFNIDGTELKITKVMASDPRRICEIVVEIFFPKNDYTDKQKRILENIVKTCPVAISLHPDIKQNVTLHF